MYVVEAYVIVSLSDVESNWNPESEPNVAGVPAVDVQKGT